MAATSRDGVDSTSLAFLTLVEPDPTSPAGYRGEDVHLVTKVQFEVYSVEPGRVASDQLLIHIVAREGQRVATLSMNEHAVRAMTSGLDKAASLIGPRRPRRPAPRRPARNPVLGLLEDPEPRPSDAWRVEESGSDDASPGDREPAGARRAALRTVPRWFPERS
jgi:hypothetical protein